MTRILEFKQDKEISPGQINCRIDNTSITCGKSWDEECTLSPDFTFRRCRETGKIVQGEDKKRRKA